MPATFKIPSIFEAIDRVSAPVKAMGKSVHSFAEKADKSINKLLPSFSAVQKEMLSFIGTAALVGAVMGGLAFSGKAIMDYEDAVASFRTIVSDLNDQDFSKYEKSIGKVAKDTKTSTIAIANSYETIAGLNAKFAESSESISAVSKASVTLGKASKSSIGEAAENLVGIMNQFDLAADQSDRTINVLAAGQAVGAASISQTAEAFKNFGSVASGANISLEKSVAMVQVMAKRSVFGAEAGTKLRGSILKLQQAGVGYASGPLNINDALTEAKARIDKLGTSKEKDLALQKMFGAENIATGRILLSNIDLLDQFTKGVTGTNEAYKAAEINSNTLRFKIQELEDAWVNIITTSDKTSFSLEAVKSTIGFVTENLDSLVLIGGIAIGTFATIKTIMLLGSAAMAIYNGYLWAWATVQAVNLALQGKTLLFMQGNIVALGAYKIITGIITAKQWLFNGALAACPIFWIIAGIMLLIGAIYLVIKYWDEWGAALSIFLGPLGLIISLFQSFRKNWDMIVEAFKTDGILGGLIAIGKTILDAVLMPLQQVMELIAKIPGMGWAQDIADKFKNFRAEIGLNTGSTESVPAINPEAERQDAMIQRMESTNNARVDLNINDPNNRVKAESDNPLVNIFTSSTMSFARG